MLSTCCFLLLAIEILHDLLYQNTANHGSTVCTGSCRIFTINIIMSIELKLGVVGFGVSLHFIQTGCDPDASFFECSCLFCVRGSCLILGQLRGTGQYEFPPRSKHAKARLSLKACDRQIFSSSEGFLHVETQDSKYAQTLRIGCR